jgi:hypothetical protein
MDVPELWLICLAIAGPVAAVVGFAIQLRQLRKLQLENTKLELEILALKDRREQTAATLVVANFAETIKYGRPRDDDDAPMFSRVRTPTNDELLEQSLLERVQPVQSLMLSVILFAICFAASTVTLFMLLSHRA